MQYFCEIYDFVCCTIISSRLIIDNVVVKWLWVRIRKPVLSKEFVDIQATMECRFTLKRVRYMIITYSLFFYIILL